MFEKILVPTDFSAYSRKVAECIGDIPGVKEIVLLHVVSRSALVRAWDPASEIKAAEMAVKEEGNAIKAPGIAMTTRAVSAIESDIAGMIQKVAAEENVSLVVMGARGKSLISSILLGSTSRSVLRFGDRHLLIMRYKVLGGTEGMEFTGAKGTRGIREEATPQRLEKFCTYIFSKVLVPTDFTQPDDAVISFIGRVQGLKELMLLHVVSRGETQEEIDADIAKSTELLKGISQQLGKDGLKVTTRVVVGNPVDEIRTIANEQDVSLIAMSSIGKDTLNTGRIGSTTYEVANTSDRPVLVIRMRPIFAVPAA